MEETTNNVEVTTEESENKIDVDVIGIPDEDLLWERKFRKQCKE